MMYTILIEGLNFPEGPCFDAEGNLWFVEIKGESLCCWNGNKLVRYDAGSAINGAAIDHRGDVWVCDSGAGAIRRFDPARQSFTTVCTRYSDLTPLVRPNDLIFDTRGNILFSDHADGRTEPLSSIAVLPQGGTEAIKVSKEKLFTNGLALGADGRRLIFAETYSQRLWQAEWDAHTLCLTNEHPFACVGKGPWGPDGIAFDEKENLYVAVFNESVVKVINKQGVEIQSIPVRASRPTSCAFDPLGRYGLVVTEAEAGEIYSFRRIEGLPTFLPIKRDESDLHSQRV